MKKFCYLIIIIGLIATHSNAIALTNEHNLSRWVTAKPVEKTEIVKNILEKAKKHGVLLVPYANSEDKNDAQKQLIICIDSIASEFPGNSIGAGAHACCEKMSYLNL